MKYPEDGRRDEDLNQVSREERGDVRKQEQEREHTGKDERVNMVMNKEEDLFRGYRGESSWRQTRNWANTE